MKIKTKSSAFAPDPKNAKAKSGLTSRQDRKMQAENKSSQSSRTARHFQSSAIKTVQGHQSVSGREGQSSKGKR